MQSLTTFRNPAILTATVVALTLPLVIFALVSPEAAAVSLAAAAGFAIVLHPELGFHALLWVPSLIDALVNGEAIIFQPDQIRVWNIILAGTTASLAGVQAGWTVFARLLAKQTIQGSRFDRALLILAGMAALSGLVGLLHQNPTQHILSDTYKLLLIPAVVLAGWRIQDPLVLRRLWTSYVILLVARIALDWILFLTNLHDGRLRFAGVHSLMALPLLLACPPEVLKGTWRRLHRVGWVAVIGQIVLLSQTRSYLVCGAVVAGVWFYRISRAGLVRSSGRALAYASLGAAAIAVLGIGLLTLGEHPQRDSSPVDVLQRRIEITFRDGEFDPSTYGRIVEAEAALGKALESPLVGYGNGAQFENPRATYLRTLGYDDLLDTVNDHYVHIMYVGILLQAGLLGLAALLYACWTAARTASAAGRVPAPVWQRWMGETALLTTWGLAVLACSKGWVSFLGNPAFAVLLALVAAVARRPSKPDPIRALAPP